jgi:UDP-N-acetylmuramate dehydrogenase
MSDHCGSLVERLDSGRLRGDMRLQEPMARHTSWRVGGAADCYYKPADVDDLAGLLAQWPETEPLLWLGLGSNLLVRDGGIRGLVVATSGMLNNLERLDNGLVRVEAGVGCPKVARFCGRQGLVGAEFLAGIPGTMGGALAMNAGAFGGETWPLVQTVETLDRHGRRYLRTPDDFQIGYRHVQGPAGEWFIAAHLSLQDGDAAQSQARIKTLLSQRGDTQPTGQPSGGSVFRNPDGDHAGRLIEACGLKGFCIGGACVSEKHANFFINTGAASAAELEALINHVRAEVESRQGVTLKTEVHIVGETLTDQPQGEDA